MISAESSLCITRKGCYKQNSPKTADEGGTWSWIRSSEPNGHMKPNCDKTERRYNPRRKPRTDAHTKHLLAHTHTDSTFQLPKQEARRRDPTCEESTCEESAWLAPTAARAGSCVTRQALSFFGRAEHDGARVRSWVGAAPRWCRDRGARSISRLEIVSIAQTPHHLFELLAAVDAVRADGRRELWELGRRELWNEGRRELWETLTPPAATARPTRRRSRERRIERRIERRVERPCHPRRVRAQHRRRRPTRRRWVAGG